MKVLILLIVLLSACSSFTKHRVVVVYVRETPAQLDTLKLDTLNVPLPNYQEVRRQEKKKNFWRGMAIGMIILIAIDVWWRQD